MGVHRGGLRTVLIVDDNAEIRRELCETLTKYEFQVSAEAANGREAIELARTCQPEVVILDMSMPEMGGLDAAPELRKLLPDSRIILFSLFADTVTEADLKARGIDVVVSKNDPTDVLIAAAEELYKDSNVEDHRAAGIA